MSDHSLSSGRLHNSLEKPVKSGWLKKQQKTFVKNWQQKYFVLKGQYLYYYKDEDDSKPQGSLFLPRSTVSEVSGSPDDVGKFIFEVIPGSGKETNKSIPDGYILMANSQPEMEEWVKGIKRAAGFPSGAVFGQRLVDTIAYEKKYGRHLVPILIEKCADFILEKGLNEEGIFRLPGQDNLVKQLKEAFDAGERPSFSMDTDVHTVASLFKLYLRELPEPVVPWSQYENYLACERTISVDEEKGHQELMMQIKILPKENYNLLSFICRFLYEVQKNSGVNKMSIDNLAMVIGVNLLKPKTEEPVALMTGAPQIQKLMTVMISHQDKFFPKTNDLLIESKTQKNDPKNMQMPRSSVGWDAAEDSVSPLGDSPNAHLRHYSHGSSISDDSLSLKEEDDCSLLPNNSESWQMYSRKRTQTLPTTSFIMSQKLGGNSPNSLKEEIFSSEFWSSPYGQKAYLSTSPGHKRTLSEEISQHRRSTYDNVPCPQDESGKNTRTGAVNESTVSGDVKKPAGQQSPNYLRNGVYCLITDNQDDNNCGRLASALEEMTIQQKILEDRMKSLEKENFDVWKKVVKLNEDLEKERNQRKALEITLQNMERSRDDAERRNKQLEQEIQGFVRAMSQAGNKP